jgi:hypothetical protein
MPARIDYLELKEAEVATANNDVSTFFHSSVVPPQFHTKQVTTKNGTFMVPTIRDVVRWSQTAHGGRQYDIDFDDDLIDIAACDISGVCE